VAKAKGRHGKSVAILGGVLLVVVILATYSNHFHNGFHFDDGHTIVNNAAIRELRNIPLFFRDATTFSTLPSNQSYRPLVSTLLAIDYQLAGRLDPFWFHVSIFTLFIALFFLLVFVTHHLLENCRATASVAPVRPGQAKRPPYNMRLQNNVAPSSNRWIALAAAGWYALHPANADAVNYIIVSAEIIATLGVIASFAFYFACPRLRRYFLFVLPAGLAILAKPTASIFPVLFAVFRLSFPNEKQRTHPKPLLEMLPPFVICGAVLLFVQHMTPRSWVAGAVNAHSYLITQPYVVLLYFKTFFWPAGLSADSDLVPLATTSDLRFWVGFAFVVVIGATAIVAMVYKKTRLIGFGLLWFLIALLPTSLFPLAEVMNDYRTFLSYVGLVIAVAGATALLAARLDRQASWTKIAVMCAVVLFLCANAYATFQRNKVWKTDETLWHDVVLKSPRNGRGLMAYGIQLMNKGDNAGALQYFHRAQQLTPQYYFLLINLAIAENATNQSAAAERHFKEALQMAPSYPDSHIYYARYLLQHSRSDEARALLRRALEMSPADVTARELLQGAAASEAEVHTKHGDELLREARFSEAIAEYETALESAPGIGSTLNNFAWLLATCPDASLRNGARAIELARKADQVVGGESPVFLRTLAAAYAENGRFNDAVATAQRALQLARGQKNAVLTGSLNKEVDRYRNNLPLHR
jgi:tetratricopeptide (TPR) repeat protein